MRFSPPSWDDIIDESDKGNILMNLISEK